ncbi:methylornithine synthase PylB [Halarsenatibacter silvermanii]|uniref:Pyrrolysine biosynthesis protein PylB n=1 Tax=Halarsenatibacter silvermanii TaxID=321763 RepID=A0A1G9HBB8_9FIRM|nr:methylornithine synthase PylB [Halarsenatibacter silvermanii]SDL10135.1 pyrrolysine biosynthesis protein PylB [Halarsenatibacter silvermanii]
MTEKNSRSHEPSKSGTTGGQKLEYILKKALRQEPLNKSEMEFILTRRDNEVRKQIFRAARRLRKRHFGRKIFAYGFVYFSTHCRNSCSFCFYRSSNQQSPRYRKDKSEVLKIARSLAEAGVHLIDLTMGEDPRYYEKNGFEELIELVSELKSETGLPIMISPGRVPDKELSKLFKAGADWYACYQETHSRELFKNLRTGQDYDRRLQVKKQAAETGFLIEEGMLLGTGETCADRARSILMMQKLEVDQGRAMSLVPQKGTPLAENSEPERNEELMTIAAIRLANPDIQIPASLDVEGIKGLIPRLKAGASVVTSLIPPASGLKGVSSAELDIEGGGRGLKAVRQKLAESGLDLELAELEDYKKWMKSRKDSARCGREAG